jgi:hypothetical protein
VLRGRSSVTYKTLYDLVPAYLTSYHYHSPLPVPVTWAFCSTVCPYTNLIFGYVCLNCTPASMYVMSSLPSGLCSNVTVSKLSFLITQQESPILITRSILLLYSWHLSIAKIIDHLFAYFFSASPS